MSDSIHIILSGFEDQSQIHVSEEGAEVLHINESEGMPKYVGARAEVTKQGNAVKIKLVDYTGTTEEVIYEAIESIVYNDDGTLTFNLPGGSSYTTGCLIGPPGTTTYSELTDKPSIEGVELVGDKSFVDLGIRTITSSEILDILNI